MRFSITRTEISPAADLGDAFAASNLEGDSIQMSSRGLLRRGIPVLPVCRELHYARVPAADWAYSLCQMKACGIGMVSTYCFWILHEPTEGELSFQGPLNLRQFLLLCRKHHMDVILRIGPFVHGEIRNGGYTGHRGESGDLYVTDPEDGAVYMYGQVDHRSRKTEQGYVLYSGDDFIPVPNSLLRLALTGKLQTTYIAIRAEADGNRFTACTFQSATAHNLPEAISVSNANGGFAADLLLTRDDLRKLNCPFIQERVQRVSGKDIGYRTALGIYDLTRKNQDAIRAAMDAQDRTTAAQNAEEAEAISNSVLNGYRVWYVVSTVRRSADRFSSLEAAMQELKSANQNPEIVKVELTQKYTKADAQGEEIEITEEEYLEASQAS